MSEDYIWKVAQSVGFDDYELKPMLEAFAAALSQPAPSPQPAVPVVSDGVKREQINALLNDDSQDSKEMHAFARAILALRPAVEPMTPEQINEMALQEEFLLVCDGVEELTEIVRAVEAHHGITAKAEGGA